VEKIFTYRITTERSVKELIELRFKYILERTQLSLDQFIRSRLKRNNIALQPNDILYPNDSLDYIHLQSDEKDMPFSLEIRYEDEYIIAIEKPDFMPVVPRTSHYFNSVAYRIWDHFKTDEYTPLHRLDIETTGILLIAKKKKYTSAFHKLFQKKEIYKTYRAFVYGTFPKSVQTISGTIEKDTSSSIFSKYKLIQDHSEHSLTQITNVLHLNGFSDVTLAPITGKTNQLRIHLAAVGHSIIGDKKYYTDETIYLDWLNTKNDHLNQMILPSQALHATSVEFIHPFSGKQVFISSENQQLEHTKHTLMSFFNQQGN